MIAQHELHDAPSSPNSGFIFEYLIIKIGVGLFGLALAANLTEIGWLGAIGRNWAFIGQWVIFYIAVSAVMFVVRARRNREGLRVRLREAIGVAAALYSLALIGNAMGTGLKIFCVVALLGWLL